MTRLPLKITARRERSVQSRWQADRQRQRGPDGQDLNATNGEELLTLRGHTDGVTCLVFTPDGRRLISSSGDGTIKIWDATRPIEAPVSSPPASKGSSFAVPAASFFRLAG